MEKLFENPSGKLKTFAKVNFVADVLAGVIGGFVLVIIDGELAGFAFLTWIGGAAVAYISSLLIYGFGELVESAENTAVTSGNIKLNTDEIKNSIQNISFGNAAFDSKQEDTEEDDELPPL